MGSKGNRKVQCQNKQQYKEPPLLRSVDDIIRQADESGLYEDCKLNIEKFINDLSLSEGNTIEIRYVSLPKATSGILNQENGKWIMSINKNDNPKRQRFTLAHELGHYILHKNKNDFFEDSVFFRGEEKTSIEYAANQFAATLLMPKKKVRSLILSGTKAVKDLAETFDVSIPAMKFRLTELGYKFK